MGYGGNGKGRKRVGKPNSQRFKHRRLTIERHAQEKADESGYPLELIVREVLFYDPLMYTPETEHSRLLHHAFNSPKDRNNGAGPIPARAV